jgi:uncharacterized membrane-anchored protein YitT (DUF2179 family)
MRMKTFFQNILKKHARKNLKYEWVKRISLKRLHKEIQNITIDISSSIKGALLISLGAISASFWLEGFLLPNGFIDGWVTGISLIVHALLTSIPLSFLLIIFNAPFIILGFFTVSRSFWIRSIWGILLLALLVQFAHFPVITDDTLLVSVFGGFFLGLWIGLAIRWWAVIDGTEVLAIFVNKKTVLSIGDVILIFNIFIFLVASYVFSIEIWLYAMLTYLVAAKTVDFVVSGTQEYIAITIISKHNEEVRVMLLEKFDKWATLYPAKSGYKKSNVWTRYNDVIYSVFTRLEIAKFYDEIEKIDSEAIIITQNIKDVKGLFHKKKIWH